MKEIKVKVALSLSEGYQKRYTQACLDALKKRDRRESVKK